jgi:crotonobetainyl-CoA:carnitine CoA-transferase CaiB-like acyl-CoA transferase
MLRDLKVVELAGVLAGPAVGMFFAELGAQVIKVENPKTNGDITRKWKLPEEDTTSPTSAYFASVNWNKQHVFLDYSKENDLQNIYLIIKEADVLICNWKMSDAVKYKLDYETIKTISPGIIYANISGFGDADPRVAYDIVLQAETGWMFMNGTPENKAQKIPVAIVDLFAAHQLKEGILVACIKKLQSGKGAYVSVSLFDAAIASLANQAANYLNTGIIPQPIGSLHPNIAPYGEIIATGDGKEFVLAIGSDKQFYALCKLMDYKELITDERFNANSARVINRAILLDLIKDRFLHFNSDDLKNKCNLLNIPIGEIRDMQQVFTQSAAMDLILIDAVGKRVRTAIFKISTQE